MAQPPLAGPPQYFQLTFTEALAALQSREQGLSSAEASERLKRVGPNQIPRARRDGPLTLIWRQINNPLIYVLLASALLAITMGKLTDGAVVLGVVVLNTLIGFVQEYRAGKAIDALIDMVPESCTVLRDGTRRTLPAPELVPGDVVLLQGGDRVPADLRLLSLKNLQVDEAALTGESLPVTKHADAIQGEVGLGDRRNLAFGGTVATSGAGQAVVYATGAATELGRISSMLRQATHIETPLTKSLARVGRWLTIGISAVALLLLGIGLLRGYSLMDAILASITLAVAAIPEGLPAIITIALAIGVQRMAGRRAVVRKLPAVETLGSTTIICSDKTGTLTRNEMTVQALWTPAGHYALSGVGYEPKGELTKQGRPVEPALDLRELLQAAALCNDADLHHNAGRYSLQGDPTEGALVVAAEKLGLEVLALRERAARLDVIPFESANQYMATLHRGGLVCVKGAPEALLRRCVELPDGSPLDAPAILREVETLALRGMRVLAMARKQHAANELKESDVDSKLTFLGLCGMIDPPRPEAIAAIAACREAGITVKMITGDHQATAQAIGRELGLVEPSRPRAITGAELARADDAEMERMAREHHVFARVAPEHKLRLVQALQRQSQVVAMTGDGVNDAPALKQADIGVAMGITGTAVAKQAADIVLTDDNFASIGAAVEEGRRVYDNLVKALAFVLPTNMGEALIILAAVAFFPLVMMDGKLAPLMPIEPVQVLWINLVATVALSLPLALEAMEPRVMKRPPRKPGEPIMSAFVWVRTVVVAVLMAAGAVAMFLYEYHTELAHVDAAVALREAQTLAVTTVILFQIFYLMNCRSLKDSILHIGLFTNGWIYLGVAALLGMQAAFVYLPVMNNLFDSAPLKPLEWLKAAAVASVVLPVIALEKWITRRRAAFSPASTRPAAPEAPRPKPLSSPAGAAT